MLLVIKLVYLQRVKKQVTNKLTNRDMELTFKLQDIVETLAISYEEATENEYKEILLAFKVLIDNKDTWRTLIYALKERKEERKRERERIGK